MPEIYVRVTFVASSPSYGRGGGTCARNKFTTHFCFGLTRRRDIGRQIAELILVTIENVLEFAISTFEELQLRFTSLQVVLDLFLREIIASNQTTLRHFYFKLDSLDWF